MAFTQQTFSPVGANSTEAPAVYAYNTVDSLATVSSTDYFIDKQQQLNEDDFIMVAASDGPAIATVNADMSTVTLSIT